MTRTKIKVSIIVPMYNTEKEIARCLETLANQTLKDIEIIVVNDGSTDNSKNIVFDYMKKYSNIVYLEKKNGGLSDARNYGMKFAKGEYIAFVDSDDFVDYTMYEKMYNVAKEKNADYVECDFYWSYHLAKNKWKNKVDKGYRYKDKKEMMAFGRVVAWNKLIKRSIIKENFPVGLLYEDIEFFYKLIPEIKKFAFVEEPLYFYVQRDNSLVNKQTFKTGQIFNIFNDCFDYYKKNNLFDEYKEELEYSYTRILLCSSLKRISKIYDNVAKEKLFYETWQNLNTKFPEWKKNKYLKNRSLKNLYMRSVNSKTYKLYCKIIG